MASTSHMKPLAFWGKNKFSHPRKHVIQGFNDYMCLHIPRGMFRPAASTFSDVRHGDETARFDEITLQLFLQMVHITAKTGNLSDRRAREIKDYPYVRVWLEWIPHESKPTEAVAYRLHAITLHEEVWFCKALDKMLTECSQMHAQSKERKMNARSADPLAGLQPYQKWMRVTGTEMYVRAICDRYSKSEEFTDRLDAILRPFETLENQNNRANPTKVFTFERAMAYAENLPATEEFYTHENYTGPDNDRKPESYLEFPSPKHVIQLTPGQMHPKDFRFKYLPDHQCWMELQKSIQAKELDNKYDKSVETEFDIRTAEDVERQRIEGFSERSAFSDMKRQAVERYQKECIAFEMHEEFPQKYQKFQEWACTAMLKQCLDPDARISEVVSKMLIWRSKTTPLKITHRITDPSLSVFANRVIAIMEGYEQYYLMSTAHKMMYLISHARYDAFRRCFNLHLNCFQAGEGATSKSFCFNIMTEMSIPGTIEVLTYQTGKSDAVDGNRNDIVTVCHEAPPGMFRSHKNPNADSSQEAMFKEKLTSQRVSCKTFHLDEATGKRGSRVTKSECIGVWMGATNDPPSEVEEALKTRFFWGNFEQQNRIGRDIDDCMNGERMMSAEDKIHREYMNQEGKEEQFRVMLVEKAIWTKVIKDVDLTAYNIIHPRFKKKMTRNSIIRPGPRDWTRVKLFARNQAIVTAIERVFNLPGGEHYGKAFDATLIPALEPYLRVTEEMVIFSLALFADQFRSPVEHKILHYIGAMEESNPQFEAPNPIDGAEQSFDYIKLPKLTQLSRKVNSRIPPEIGRTSTNNIKDFLLKMSKHTILSKKYHITAASSRNGKYPVINPKSKPKDEQSCVVASDGVYIHVSHILAHRQDSADSVFDILSSETHKHSRTKRMLTACTYNNKWFHILKVIERKCGGEGLKWKNVLANSKTSRWITNTTENNAPTRICDRDHEINEDVDDYVARKWTKIIGKRCYTPNEIIRSVVNREYYSRPKITYPADLIQATLSVQDDQVEEHDELEDSLEEEDDLENSVIGKKRAYESKKNTSSSSSSSSSSDHFITKKRAKVSSTVQAIY